MKSIRSSALAATGLAVCAAASFAGPVDDAIDALASAHPGVVTVEQFGETGQGRALRVIRIAAGEGDPDSRPALLVVAGVSAMHLVGTDVALGLAEKLAADHAADLENTTVYVVPVLNADAQAVHRENGGPKVDFSRTFTPVDADGDWRTDEDSRSDLNGDTYKTMMRLKDPPPGVPATHTIDPDNPRLMRPADPAKGERNDYAIFAEGVDDDGDGRIGEDGPGGVDLDLNFPSRWPEFHEAAGEYQLDQPESKSLVHWMLEHKNISAVVVFGPHDNMVNAPEAGRFDQTRRVPTGIETGDKPYHDEMARIFKGITRMNAAPTADFDGSFALWAYTHFGVPTFATPVWVRPDQLAGDGEPEGGAQAPAPKADAPAPRRADPDARLRALVERFQTASEEERAQLLAQFQALPQEQRQRAMQLAISGGGGRGDAQQPAQRRARRGAVGGAERPAAQPRRSRGRGNENEDAAWLKYSDEERGGEGFVQWRRFRHPQLGTVEIGGFVPGFKTNPPAGETPRLVDEQARFALEVAQRLPRLSIADPYVEKVGDGVWRVVARVANGGYLPTVSAMGRKTRTITPVVMKLDPRAGEILVGAAQQVNWRVEGSGGEVHAEWIVAARNGARVTVTIRSSALGEETISIRLREE